MFKKIYSYWDEKEKIRWNYKLNNRLYLVKHLQGNKIFFFCSFNVTFTGKASSKTVPTLQ